MQNLQQISSETFRETFANRNKPEHINQFLKKAFNIEQLDKEHSDRYSQVYFVYHQNDVAGYLKINFDDAQSEEMNEGSFEIERIYFRSKFQKRDFGKYLFDKALEIARNKHKYKIWLGVWEKNENATAFYKNLGFVQDLYGG